MNWWSYIILIVVVRFFWDTVYFAWSTGCDLALLWLFRPLEYKALILTYLLTYLQLLNMLFATVLPKSSLDVPCPRLVASTSVIIIFTLSVLIVDTISVCPTSWLLPVPEMHFTFFQSESIWAIWSCRLQFCVTVDHCQLPSAGLTVIITFVMIISITTH